VENIKKENIKQGKHGKHGKQGKQGKQGNKLTNKSL
jgi:hypothetical protein